VPAARARTRVLCAAERILFAIAAFAFGWYAAVSIAAVREQDALSRELEQARAGANRAASARSIHPKREVVGRIEVRRLRLKAVAREGVDSRTLRGAVGHVPGTAWPGEAGNAAFAAHRDTFFRPLKGVRAGDEVTITAPDGVYRYVVTGTRVVNPSDVSVLRPSADPTLTLVTCYPFDYVGSAPQRFIVSGRLVAPPRAVAAAGL
jgi:sortase A